VDFVARLRETLKFGSVDELVAQMRRDVAEVRPLLLA
jgi:FAD synthase